jgi:hypothetical protein
LNLKCYNLFHEGVTGLSGYFRGFAAEAVFIAFFFEIGLGLGRLGT